MTSISRPASSPRQIAEWLDLVIAFVVVAVPGWFTINKPDEQGWFSNQRVLVILIGWLALAGGGLVMSYWLLRKKQETRKVVFESGIQQDVSQIKRALHALATKT